MTLFEIADVLWQRGENEAYNALVKHAREYSTVVECGLTLLSRDIAKRALRYERFAELDIDPMIWTDEDYSPCDLPLTEEQIRWRVEEGLNSAFESDSPLLNLSVWEEAERRVARKDLDDAERERLVWGTYTYLLSGDEEAELQLHDDRREEAYMRACERDSPNSLEFDALVESIYEQLCEENWRAA